MKSIVHKASSGLLISALLLTGAPVANAQGRTLRNAEQRCERVAGREQARCKFINTRNTRLRFRRQNASFPQRGHTLREQRQVFKNRPASNIRRIGSPSIKRLRRHDASRGRARRLINLRRENATKTCKGIPKGVERTLCMRDQWRAKSRGNTK